MSTAPSDTRHTFLRPLLAIVLGLTVVPFCAGRAQDPLARALAAAEADAESRLAEDEAMLDLLLPPSGPQTTTVIRRGADALIPFARFAALAELRAELVTAERWEGFAGGGQPLVVDAVRLVARRGATTLALADSQVAVRSGELHLSAASIAALLGVRVDVLWPALQVRIAGADSLPLLVRLRREEGYRRLARTRHDEMQRAERDLGARRRLLGGLVAEYALTAPVNASHERSTYVAALGGELLGGALEARTRGGFRDQAQYGRTTWSWVGAWEDSPWLRQLRAGDIGGTGLRGRLIRGVALTNAPYRRDSHMGSAAFAGELGPGWTIEAYRNGMLVGVDTTDASGRFAFDVSVGYGENPVDFVAYGPHGERRSFSQQYQLPVTLLPAGRFEYGLSAGACSRASLRRDCGATGNADLRYGLTERWVLEAGADWYRRDSLGALAAPYASVYGSPINAVTVEAQAMAHGFTRGAVRVEPSRGVRLSAEHLAYSREPATSIIVPPGRRSESNVTATLRPFASSGDVAFLDASASRLESAAGAVSYLSVTPSVRLSTLLLQPYGRWVVPDARSLGRGVETHAGLRTSYSSDGRIRELVGPLFVSGQVESEGRRLGFASLSLLRSIRGGIRLGGSVDWRAGDRRPTLGLSVWWDHERVRSATTVTRPAHGEASAVQTLQGSALWNAPSNDLELSGGSYLQQGGLAGHVFVDENGNGRRDAAEPLIEGIGVTAGGRTVRSNARGEFLLTNLVPFEPLLFALDTLRRDDPSIVPGFATARVMPAPNGVRIVDVPFVPSGTIDGRVTLTSGGRTIPVPSVPLVVTSRATGRSIRTTTFSDGGFYVTGLPPADYTIAVDPAVLAAQGWVGEAVTATLRFEAGGAVVEGLVLALTATR